MKFKIVMALRIAAVALAAISEFIDTLEVFDDVEGEIASD